MTGSIDYQLPPPPDQRVADPTAFPGIVIEGVSKAFGPKQVLDAADLPNRRSAAARQSAIRARQQRVLDDLPAGVLSIGRRYENLAGFAGRVGPAAIEALARHPAVAHVSVDRKAYASLAQGRVLTGADSAHAVGITGGMQTLNERTYANNADWCSPEGNAVDDNKHENGAK